MRLPHLAVVFSIAALLLQPSPALAIPLTPDTFEDGTTQGWIVNLLGMGVHPAPPVNVPTGGPGGADDNYLLLTAVGGVGQASRMTGMNLAQWTGDYLAAGFNAIALHANNFGPDDLHLRLAFEDPLIGPPTNIAFSTDPIVVPAGSGWVPIAFPIAPAFLTAGLGTVNAALANTTLLRIYHSVGANFPNPVVPIPSVSAELGLDNIRVIPEPSSLLLVAGGLAALARRRQRSRP